ncbi:ribulose-phosphate 3-epimerase [Trueperella bialowiezensis]|uniref:D-allulose-6-phosphate 3-epimerase n=1 Tax=Trueperella bialowiezensis TaxID=312285 RepID=A0A3S4UY70_9ACTO|nr:ribulose-phosphate 3-epimerase [Trueperella bialowiezensis]VEI12784.1 D-allulose-6-phosphate 3-epimerase [Trueperella bialowiezensis]
MILNLPSLANCDLMELPEQVDELVAAGVTMFHIDLMDGHYVPNLCFPVRVISDIKQRHPHVQFDAHMMVDNPADYIDELADAGATHMAFHADATSFAVRTLSACKKRGMGAGVAINPSMPIDIIRPYVHLLDYVILMTVEPGFSGQPFLDGSLERLSELSALRAETGSDFKIEIDGGVTPELAPELVKRGADWLVTGIYVTFNHPEGITAAVKKFADQMEQAEREFRS